MEIEIRDFDILLVSAAHTVARGNTEVLETFLESKRNKNSPRHTSVPPFVPQQRGCGASLVVPSDW